VAGSCNFLTESCKFLTEENTSAQNVNFAKEMLNERFIAPNYALFGEKLSDK